MLEEPAGAMDITLLAGQGLALHSKAPQGEGRAEKSEPGEGCSKLCLEKNKTKIITISEGNLKLPIKQTDPEPSASLTSASFKAITDDKDFGDDQFSKP